jgi:hypothetical protein
MKTDSEVVWEVLYDVGYCDPARHALIGKPNEIWFRCCDEPYYKSNRFYEAAYDCDPDCLCERCRFGIVVPDAPILIQGDHDQFHHALYIITEYNRCPGGLLLAEYIENPWRSLNHCDCQHVYQLLDDLTNWLSKILLMAGKNMTKDEMDFLAKFTCDDGKYLLYFLTTARLIIGYVASHTGMRIQPTRRYFVV